MLTVILHDWQRRANMLRLIESLQRQTVKPRIVVWNNNPEPFPQVGVDWVINSSENDHVRSFTWLAAQADTRFVGRFDDDLMPDDDTLLERLEAVMARIDDPSVIVGKCGVRLQEGKSYWESLHVETSSEGEQSADIIKGRTLFADSSGITGLGIAGLGLVDASLSVHVDILLSLKMTSNRNGNHVVSDVFADSMQELTEGSCGYRSKPEHNGQRQIVTELFR